MTVYQMQSHCAAQCEASLIGHYTEKIRYLIK